MVGEEAREHTPTLSLNCEFDYHWSTGLFHLIRDNLHNYIDRKS